MPGLREALEDAFDEIDTTPAEAVEVPAEAAPAEPVETAAPEAEVPATDRARDESGKFVPQKEAKPAAQSKPPPRAVSPATSAPPAGQGATAVATPPGAAAVVAPALKAPQSWKPAEREKWAALPPEAQQAVLRRESEVAKALQERADATKGYGAFTEAVRPYEALIRASGQQPHEYVGTLLQTAHSLFYGPANNKPALLADLIMQAGVPPEALDQALVARMTGQGQRQPQAPQQFTDPRVDRLLQQLDAARTERTTAQQAEATSTADAFAQAHEFFHDVADDFADILDLWAKRGKTEVTDADLERAYEIACQQNESVSTVLAGRKAVVSVQNAQASTARAKAASSSIKSQPTAATAAQPTGRRAVLEAAYDEANQ